MLQPPKGLPQRRDKRWQATPTPPAAKLRTAKRRLMVDSRAKVLRHLDLRYDTTATQLHRDTRLKSCRCAGKRPSNGRLIEDPDAQKVSSADPCIRGPAASRIRSRPTWQGLGTQATPDPRSEAVNELVQDAPERAPFSLSHRVATGEGTPASSYVSLGFYAGSAVCHSASARA
jgi:hypothetical protein